jgi:hypothetical protein
VPEDLRPTLTNSDRLREQMVDLRGAAQWLRAYWHGCELGWWD